MIAKLLSDSWSFFGTHLAAIAWILLPFVIPLEIFVSLVEYFLIDESSSFLAAVSPSLLLLAISPVWTAALIFYIASVATKEHISIKKAWLLGIEYWVPALVLLILTYLVVGFGLILLIIPGIWFAIKLSFAFFELLLGGENPLGSMKLSWSRTTGYGGTLLVGGLIFLGTVYVAYGLIGILFDTSSLGYLFVYTVTKILTSLLGALFTVFVFRVYWLAMEQHECM